MIIVVSKEDNYWFFSKQINFFISELFLSNKILHGGCLLVWNYRHALLTAIMRFYKIKIMLKTQHSFAIILHLSLTWNEVLRLHIHTKKESLVTNSFVEYNLKFAAARFTQETIPRFSRSTWSLQQPDLPRKPSRYWFPWKHLSCCQMLLAVLPISSCQ